MPARKQKNVFGWLRKSKVTYHRDVAGERKKLKAEAMAERRERLAIKKLRAQELAAEAKIKTAERRIAVAEERIAKAEKKADKGSMAEAQFEAMKVRMEREIQAQEEHKRAALAKLGNPKRCGRNPAASAAQYRLAQAVLSGTARETRMSKAAARELVDRTPARLRSQYSRSNPEVLSTEYRLGYNLGQMDRQTAALPKTWAELEATFNANFPAGSRSDALPFFEAYRDGYDLGRAEGGETDADGQRGENPPSWWSRKSRHIKFVESRQHQEGFALGVKDRRAGESAKSDSWLRSEWEKRYPDLPPYQREAFRSGYNKGYFESLKGPKGRLPNPEPVADDSEEYKQALRTAELFHGRPVVEKITVTESIRSHDWHVRIGPLVSLKVRTVTKKNVLIPFHQTEKDMVHLFVSPDGRQFYLRGGDQELELDSVGMGPGSDWFRDQMLIGDAKEITYRDKKKFHKFKLTDYYHKLGEETGVKPVLAYDSLAGKLSLIGGQYRVETEDLVEDMSPGIVN